MNDSNDIERYRRHRSFETSRREMRAHFMHARIRRRRREATTIKNKRAHVRVFPRTLVCVYPNSQYFEYPPPRTPVCAHVVDNHE